MLKVDKDVVKAISTGEPLAYSIVRNGAATRKLDSDEGVSPFPPILLALHQLLEGTQDFETVRDFERTTLALREIAFGQSSSHVAECLPSCSAETLSKAVRDVIVLNAREAGRCDLKIHLEGLHIAGDLDLSGLDLNCPVRLVACFIEGALIIDRARLATLDISGSIISKGVSATHLETTGSVRCRRTISLGIMDFGGCRIDGPFDMSDAIIIPFTPPPRTSPWVADRSILNLSLGKISKEARFSRSRVHGGINIRGLEIDGSLFMNDIIVRSPLATIEKLMLETRDQAVQQLVKCFHESANSAELDLATLILQGAQIKEFPLSDRVKFEVLNFLVPPGFERDGEAIASFDHGDFSRACLLYRLLFELTPVQTYAIRADGVTILGSFFGRRMRIGGRMKFRRSTVKGRVSFNGSHFRTVRTMYELCRELSKKSQTHQNAPSVLMATMFGKQLGEDRFIETKARREYAIDFRDSEIGESFEISKDTKKSCPRRNERLLVDIIVRKLLQTPNDPRAFLQVFFGKAGKIEDYIAKSYHSDETSTGGRDFLHLYQDVSQCAYNACSIVYYERLLRHARQFKSKNTKPVSKQTPDEIVSAIYPRAGVPTLADGFVDAAAVQIDDSLFSADIENTLVVSVCEMLILAHTSTEADSCELRAMGNLKEAINSLWTVYSDEAFRSSNLKFTDFERRAEKVARCVKMQVAVETFRLTRTQYSKDSSSRLNCPLLMGEIAFSNARIGSSVTLTGLIANMFDDDTTISGAKKRDELQKQYRPTIVLYNACIKGDFDIRDSVGIRSIDGVQVKIDGSLKMSDSPDFQLKKDRYGNVFRRALFNAVPILKDPNDQRSIPKFDFEAAKIAGNATFVFDFEFGPSINLRSGSINGQMSILPNRGHIEFASGENRVVNLPDLHDLEEKRALEFRRAAYELGTLRVQIWHALNRRLSLRDWSNPTAYDMTPAEAVKTLSPHIDLRGARCEMFVHPMTSWPKQDVLQIEGFRYERTHNSGPLLAKRRTWKMVEEQFWNAGIIEDFIKKKPRIFALMATFLAVTLLFIQEIHDFVSSFDQYNAILILSRADHRWLVIDTLAIFLLFFWLLLRGTRPKRTDYTPRALAYLKLQRRQFNLRRRVRIIQSYDPYVHAARTLRSSGHLASAADIERERLKLREHALSWRMSPIQKIALKVVDALVGYGFRPGRLAVISLFVWLAGTTFVSGYAEGGGICDARPSVVKGIPQHDSMSNFALDVVVQFLYLTIDQKQVVPSCSGRTLRPLETVEFSAPLYTLDIMVPFLDLNQEDKWHLVSPDLYKPKTDLAAGEYALDRKSVRIFWLFAPLMKIIGWFLSAVIAISIVSKAETIIARNEDN